MPVIDISMDLDALTLTITAQFAAPVERVWQVYADPRQLERVWGPPSHPAIFEEHSLTPGGRMHYFMTSPEGEKFAGVWEVRELKEPDSFTFVDYFADLEYAINQELPGSTSDYRFAPFDGGTRATFVAAFDSAEGLQQVLDMGMQEGARQAINQIDGLLAA